MKAFLETKDIINNDHTLKDRKEGLDNIKFRSGNKVWTETHKSPGRLNYRGRMNITGYL